MEVLDSLPCAVVVTDEAGSILAVNAEFTVLAGGVRLGWIGAPIEDLLSPAGRIFMQTHVWPLLLQHGKVSEVHLQVENDRHLRVPVLVNCAAGIFEESSAYFWTLFVALERHQFEAELVKARNRAETEMAEAARMHDVLQEVSAELAEKNQFLSVTLQAIGEAVITADERGIVTWLNPVAERMTGWTMDVALGQPLGAVFTVVDEESRCALPV